MGHTKEEEHKQRILKALTNEWVSQSGLFVLEPSVSYYRIKELLHVLEYEGLVEFKINDKYTYWRLKQ